MEIFNCISLGFELINEIIDIRAKVRNNQDCCDDLIRLVTNYKTYNKQEKRLIRDTLRLFLEVNKTRQNSGSGSNVNVSEHDPNDPNEKKE